MSSFTRSPHKSVSDSFLPPQIARNRLGLNDAAHELAVREAEKERQQKEKEKQEAERNAKKGKTKRS